MRRRLNRHCFVGGMGCALGLSRGAPKALGFSHCFPEIAQTTVAE